jgi:hypothetical protein
LAASFYFKPSGAMAAIGTKRTFAALQQFVRFWARADIGKFLKSIRQKGARG